MSGLDRIWAWPRLVRKTDGGTWSDHELPRSTEYIRRDPAVIAALPEVQALIAGAVAKERERADLLQYVLGGVKSAIDTGRNEPLQIWRDQIVIALGAAAIRKRGEG